jgi:glycosyltransferase involved in cell wall biosynthesis
MTKTILFISHDANRAGAQVLLLRWLRLFKQQTDFKVLVLLKYGGVLQADFEALVPTFVWYMPSPPQTNGLFGKVWNKLMSPDLPQEQVKKTLAKTGIDLIVSNTLTNGDILPELEFLNVPIISYVHELEMHLQQYTTPEALANTFRLTHHYAVCAKVAGENLVHNHGISSRQITWIPTPAPNNIPLIGQGQIQQIRDRLGIKQAVVGGIGSVDERKGVDIFVQLATKMPTADFVWVGGTRDQFEIALDTDDLPDNLFCIANTPNVYPYLSCFDVFVLTSRMEVFPLVVMEAYSLEKAVVCFEQAGGTKELVEDDAGFVIPDLDVEAMQEKITYILKNPSIAEQMGKRGNVKLVTQYQESFALGKFVGLLKSLF